MSKFKKLIFSTLFLGVLSFSFVQSQQLDIYREIARSQQQIMTVYKYLLTEYIHELDIKELTSRVIDSMLSNFDPYTEYYEEKDLAYACNLKGRFTNQSVRIGGATSYAKRNFTNVQIQQAGRWRSNAFKSYIRLDNEYFAQLPLKALLQPIINDNVQFGYQQTSQH